MTIGYRCDAGLGCTFILWDGEVSPGEWRDHFERLTNDPDFPPGALILGDLRTAGGALSIGSDIVKEIAIAWQARAERIGPIKVAIVPNGAWDKARELERAVDGSGITTIVFNNLPTACTWLGVDAASAAAVLEKLHGELS